LWFNEIAPMKQKLEIVIRGKHKEWGFPFYGDPKYIPEWEADGLTVHEVLNTIPEWAQRMGLTRIFCRVQDAWNWLRLW
jgi:hypothetical protein